MQPSSPYPTSKLPSPYGMIVPPAPPCSSFRSPPILSLTASAKPWTPLPPDSTRSNKDPLPPPYPQRAHRRCSRTTHRRGNITSQSRKVGDGLPPAGPQPRTQIPRRTDYRAYRAYRDYFAAAAARRITRNDGPRLRIRKTQRHVPTHSYEIFALSPRVTAISCRRLSRDQRRVCGVIRVEAMRWASTNPRPRRNKE